jgi:hypothetical protein
MIDLLVFNFTRDASLPGTGRLLIELDSDLKMSLV